MWATKTVACGERGVTQSPPRAPPGCPPRPPPHLFHFSRCAPAAKRPGGSLLRSLHAGCRAVGGGGFDVLLMPSVWL